MVRGYRKILPRQLETFPCFPSISSGLVIHYNYSQSSFVSCNNMYIILRCTIDACERQEEEKYRCGARLQVHLTYRTLLPPGMSLLLVLFDRRYTCSPEDETISDVLCSSPRHPHSFCRTVAPSGHVVLSQLVEEWTVLEDAAHCLRTE